MRMARIAYNLIRSSCQEAAHAAGKDLRLMSFKGALDTVVANTARYLRRQKLGYRIAAGTGSKIA
jgi:hypothetical protein